MRQITVWISTFVLIALVFFGWYITVPMKKGFEERFDSMVDYSDNQPANITYNRIKTSVGNAQNLILYLFTAIFLLWAYGNMQSREKYSGEYG